MPVVVVDILLAVFVAAVGMGAGWLLRGTMVRKRSRRIPTDKSISKEAAQDKKLTRNVLDQLQDLADGMAADVDQHSNRVREISDELSGTSDPNCVVSAVTKIIAANESMQQQLAEAEQRLQEQSRQIEQHTAEARTDALTQLANRRAFDDAMKRAVERYQKHGRPLSVMLLDVDHFKNFNDTHGHQAGDEVLRGVARVLRDAFSKAELVARYGGEEFAVIFPGTAIDEAKRPAERGRAAIAEETFEFEGKTLTVTASAGLAEMQNGESLDDLVRRADDALYASKRAGRSCGHWHDGKSCLPLAGPEESCNPDSKLVPSEPDTNEESINPDRQDPVTGLSNRTAFCEEVNRRVAEWKRGGADVTVMLVQVDKFQAKVRQHDSEVGTLLLRATTQFLKGAMRDMDHIARFDDDVFALLLPGTGLANAAAVAERLRRAVDRYKLSRQGQTLRFSVSVGLAQACSGDTAPRLMERAQAALDTACEVGGNAGYLHDGKRCERVAVDTVPAM